MNAAMLCDAAAIRDGLLSVISGGIDQWAPSAYPAPLNLAFAGLIEVDGLDQLSEHEFQLELVDENLRWVGSASAGFVVQGVFGPDDVTVVPVVVPLAGITIGSFGDYELRLLLDGVICSKLALRAMAI